MVLSKDSPLWDNKVFSQGLWEVREGCNKVKGLGFKVSGWAGKLCTSFTSHTMKNETNRSVDVEQRAKSWTS